MIRREGSSFDVRSSDGSRSFGIYPTRGAADRRLGQVEYFKQRDALSDERSKQKIQDLEALTQRYEDLLDKPPGAEQETTRLSPDEEARFRDWTEANGVTDVDNPDSHYDYRGFFQGTGGAPHRRGDHFPDTFKQHGHPTFSVESRYSRGPGDGGSWQGERFTPGAAPPPAQYPELRSPDTSALDEAYRRPGSYSYEYKDPSMPGAAPGRQVGPMADELRDIPGVVSPGGDGLDRVNTDRLTMANASQTAKHRRELDELKRRLDDLSDEGDSEGVLQTALGRR